MINSLLKYGAWILYPFLAFGIIAYIIQYFVGIAEDKDVSSPLGIAGVAATIGGFILLGAFYDERNQRQYKELKDIAKLFLGSTVFFVVAFFLVQGVSTFTAEKLNLVQNIYIILTDATFGIASILICLGIVYLISILKKI